MLQTLIKIQHLAEETSKQSVYGAYGLHPRGKKGYCLSCCLVSGPKSIPEHSSVAEQRHFSSQTVVRFHLFQSGSNTLLYDFLPSKGIPAAVEMPFSMQVSESDTFYIAIFHTARTAPA